VGPLVETLVQSVLRGSGLQVHFYRQLRDPKRPKLGFEEVDFVVEALDGSLIPIEVKFRRRIDSEDRATLLRFMEKYKPPMGIMVTREAFEIDKKNRILLVPLMDFLLAF
jgi:predicted AAA+ superfamily ATPase